MSELNDKLISYGNLSHFYDKLINDSVTSGNSTWSSEKINTELEALAGTANSEIDGKETEDFRFVTELPVSGEDGEQVIIKGDNEDTLYKFVSGEWTVQAPDATKLYFDTENEVLYSYASLEHQFVRISMVNTIVVGSNLNTNADLKALKTVGVYNVVQRLHNATKGDYVKNWTLYVESIDYEEYDRSDSVYQKLVSNYTIQKRTWSATRATNDGWSNFSTYYTGEIKDTTTSKYYTWSSNKISNALANIPQLEAGENIEIADNKINAKGYFYDDENRSFAVSPYIYIEALNKYPVSMLGDCNLTGVADATTYTVGGQDAASVVDQFTHMQGMGVMIGSGAYGLIVSADSTNLTVTLDRTLSSDTAISSEAVTYVVVPITLLISGAANATTYTVTDPMGFLANLKFYLDRDLYIKFGDYETTKVNAIDTVNGTITFDKTLDANNAVSDAPLVRGYYSNAIASGIGSFAANSGEASGDLSHAEGSGTASGEASHAEGYYNIASGRCAHAEGGSNSEVYKTTASGVSSHAEGYATTASGLASHAEGYYNIAQNQREHAEGSNNLSHKVSDTFGNAGNTIHSIGIGNGTSSSTSKNAEEIMQNGDVYIYGVGGYQGTDTKVQDATIKTLQEYIASLEARISALENPNA